MAMPNPPYAPVGLSAKHQLVLTAERLFALRGLDGVSLRQIGTEAGMANKSAVHYHFGSKQALVEAILLNRVEVLVRRRQLLEARATPGNLRAAIEAHQLPLIELAEDETCFYLPFLEQLLRHAPVANPLAALPDTHLEANRAYVELIGSLIPHVPQPLRDHRIHQVSALCVHVCADRHRARLFGTPMPSYALHVSDLLDGIVCYLESTPSAESLAALDEADQVSTGLRALP